MRGNGKTEYLKGDMLHFSYYTIEEHLLRINRYTTISANALYDKGVRSNWGKILINPFGDLYTAILYEWDF